MHFRIQFSLCHVYPQCDLLQVYFCLTLILRSWENMALVSLYPCCVSNVHPIPHFSFPSVPWSERYQSIQWNLQRKLNLFSSLKDGYSGSTFSYRHLKFPGVATDLTIWWSTPDMINPNPELKFATVHSLFIDLVHFKEQNNLLLSISIIFLIHHIGISSFRGGCFKCIRV